MADSASPADDPQSREQLEVAIRKSYTSDELNQALLFEWGLELEEIAGLDQGRIQIVNDLVSWTERTGKTTELFAFLYRRRSGNPLLQAIAQRLGIAAELPPAPEKPADREALVKRSRFIDVSAFNARSTQVSRRLCRVETPAGSGTGFLVAPDLVLTAYHVVETAAAARAEIACIFDFHAQENGERVASAANWLRAPSAAARRSGPSADNLDFALVQLGRTIGTEGPEPVRGWFKLRDALPVVSLRDLVVIAQHPRARPQQYAWGEVTRYAAAIARVSYDTSTDKGSSGAPCMDTDLSLFALHVSAGESDNNGVPIRLIVDQLKHSRALRKALDV